MLIVADSSPLIFLGKIRKLVLIKQVFAAEILVPRSVRDEVLAPPLEPVEASELQRFIATCKVETVARPTRFAAAMSRADNDAVTIAVRRSADFLLADDHLVREVALTEGVRPVGTLGVLLRAVRRRLLSAGEARSLVDLLIRAHGFRIGVELYQAVLRELEV